MSKILIFYLNSSSIRWCETLDQKKENEKRQGIFNVFKKPCNAPYFVVEMINIISNNNPDIVIVGTSDEPESQTYLHSDLLPIRLGEYQYEQVDRIKKVGPGTVGSDTELAMRCSIFIKRGLSGGDKDISFDQSPFICYNQSEDRTSGAICIYYKTYQGTSAFILVDLPDTASKLTYQMNGTMVNYRTMIKASNTLCLGNVINKFITKDIHHVVIFGDLNYEVTFRPSDGVNNKELSDGLYELSKIKQIYSSNDELKKEMMNNDSLFHDFKEGVNGRGVEFPPTFPMRPGRLNNCKERGDCYNLNYNDGSYPSWRERVIYKDIGISNYTLYCNNYNSFNVIQDTHNGIYCCLEYVYAGRDENIERNEERFEEKQGPTERQAGRGKPLRRRI